MTEEVKLKLQEAADIYETEEFLIDDPSKFMHQFGHRYSIEIIAFICSWLAFGNRKSILEACEKIVKIMSDFNPYLYIVNGAWKKHLNSEINLYRFYTWGDFANLCYFLNEIYTNYSSFEEAIRIRTNKMGGETKYLVSLMSFFRDAKGVPSEPKSACKRLNLFLRWMCRKNSPVDLGLWNLIPTEELLIPLDTHVAKTARELGLLTGKSNNMGAVLRLTKELAEAFPNDPVRGDYALFGLGVNNEQINIEKDDTQENIFVDISEGNLES